MEKEIKKQLVMVGLLVLAIVVIGVSGAYAFYVNNPTGNADVDKKAAKFEMETTLNSSSAINVTSMVLIDSADVASKSTKFNFTVTNKSISTVDGLYQIILTDISLTKNLYSQYFKWELLGDNVSLATGNFSTATRTSAPEVDEDARIVTTAANITLNTTAFQLAPGVSKNLELRVWLENDSSVNQIDLTSGNFSGKLAVEGTPTK